MNKEMIIEHLQNYLDLNVNDYTNFDGDYGFKQYKKQYRKMNFDYLELTWIARYLLDLEEENKQK